MSKASEPIRFITSIKFQWPGADEWLEIELPDDATATGFRSEILSHIEQTCRNWTENRSGDKPHPLQKNAEEIQALIRYIRTTESQNLYAQQLDLNKLIKRKTSDG